MSSLSVIGPLFPCWCCVVVRRTHEESLERKRRHDGSHELCHTASLLRGRRNVQFHGRLSCKSLGVLPVTQAVSLGAAVVLAASSYPTPTGNSQPAAATARHTAFCQCSACQKSSCRGPAQCESDVQCTRTCCLAVVHWLVGMSLRYGCRSHTSTDLLLPNLLRAICMRSVPKSSSETEKSARLCRAVEIEEHGPAMCSRVATFVCFLHSRQLHCSIVDGWAYVRKKLIRPHYSFQEFSASLANGYCLLSRISLDEGASSLPCPGPAGDQVRWSAPVREGLHGLTSCNSPDAFRRCSTLNSEPGRVLLCFSTTHVIVILQCYLSIAL